MALPSLALVERIMFESFWSPFSQQIRLARNEAATRKALMP
jgi:hypothetical protein